MLKILKFSYFLLFILVFSCKDAAQKPNNEGSIQNDSVKAKVSEDAEGKVILFFGNSLTAGYGLDTKEAFPALIQQRIDSLQLGYTVVNAGLSGETTSGGKNRLNWVLDQQVDVFVLELGANDGLRGIPLSETKSNLQIIIDTVREKNPEIKIVLAGMQIPPNMGPVYTEEFKSIFPELADKNNVELIPFLLEGVAGNPKLNLEDGMHPNGEGQKIVADNVWEIVKKVIR